MSDRVIPLGRPLMPLQVIQAIRWRADLTPAEMVDAIHAGAADPTLARRWPELDEAEIRTMRDVCAAMTKSRLRSWKDGTRKATWHEVRGLISGLHSTLASDD